MKFSVGDAFSEAIERLTTQAGAILIAGITLFSVLRTGAGQDIYSGIVERILSELQRSEFRSDLGPEQLEAVESAEAELEASIADLPLSLGLDPAIAAVVWLVAYVLGLAVIVVALDTFGRGRDTLSGIETDDVGMKVLNLFLGSFVFGILVTVGLLLLVIPGLLVIVFLLFFPAAIVLDGESFFSAFSSSAGLVRENFLSTLGLLLVSIVVLVVLGLVGVIVSGALSGAPGAIASEVFAAVGTAFSLALIARAYVTGTR